MTTAPTLSLSDGRTIPKLGFGLWQVPADTAADTVAGALNLGYRLLDGAAIYGNEEGLGQGLRQSGLARDEVFVTSKIWNDRHGFDTTLAALDESLARLGVAALDLCLIHWPCPDQDLYVDTWRALIQAKADGKARSIGVSNFNADHLERLVGETGEVPVLNQIELHPQLQQADLRAFHADHGIVTQSWTPLGQSRSFDDPVVQAIATRVSRSPAQVILRWHLQLGCAVIPRSTHAGRMAQNMALFDFELHEADMQAMTALHSGQRTGPDPLVFS